MKVFSVNGQKVEVELDSRESLLVVLQDRLGPFGTKNGLAASLMAPAASACDALPGEEEPSDPQLCYQAGRSPEALRARTAAMGVGPDEA
jgi:hypothetical protein